MRKLSFKIVEHSYFGTNYVRYSEIINKIKQINNKEPKSVWKKN